MVSARKEKIKLDQLLKVMFKLSKKVTVNLLNGLFDENYNPKNVKVQYTNNEFVLESLEKIYGDMFIKVQSHNKTITYHIEFQTQNDSSMAIRMFRYGFENAVESIDNVSKEKIRLDFPKQLVIFLEENNNIKDDISFILTMPDGNELNYIVPTMKYWKYSEQDLVDKKLYALLPFQVFKLRKAIESISCSNKPHEQKAQLIYLELKKLFDVSERVAKISSDLYNNKEIIGADFKKILLVLKNISDYLYDKYGEYPIIEKEVKTMLTTLYNPALVKKGIAEGIEKRLPQEVQKKVQKEVQKEVEQIARTALEKGSDVDFVSEITKLDIETVKKIQAEIQDRA